MSNQFDTFKDNDGIYKVNKNNNYGLSTSLQNANTFIGAVQDIRSSLIREVDMFNQAIEYKEHTNQRYWNGEVNFNQIINNENNKYQNLLNCEQNYLSHINSSNYPYGIWRYKKDFYYRPNPDSNLCSGNVEEISKELSSRYPVNFHLIPDLNIARNNINEVKFDTVYLSTKSIIVIEGEVVAPLEQYEIFQDSMGRLWRNLIQNTDYLKKRFENHYLDTSYTTKTRFFIQKISTPKDSMFLLNRLGKFFKSLHGEKIIMMLGNQNVSKDIFLNKCFKMMIHPENYITITDEILRKNSFEEILKGKILLHIDQIPQEQELREKLKELLIQVQINKSYQSENRKIETFAQVIATIDEKDAFIKDFEHLSDIFYINPLEDILSNVNEINDVSLIGNIQSNLMKFAEELSAIGNEQLNTDNCSTGNQRFLEELIETNLETDILSNTGLPILDPYNESYENIISNYERFKHTYIIANQGYGKSQLIITLIMRDYFLNDCSVVLLDAHGDLGEDLLRIIPDKERLVYIDLYLDSSSMPTINLFDSIDKNDEDTIYKVTQLIMSVFKNISSEDKLNGLMENVAENCISVMLREGGGSFWELYQFLGGTGSKDWVTLGKNSPNELEADFFNNEFENENPTRTAVRRRLSKLIRDPKFSAFMNRKSTLNLEQLVNTKGKIIIFNIASGRMPNTYQYYMKFLVGYLQLIALKRVSIKKEDRTFTQLYLDEFHLFLDKSKNLEEILTGARKYRMFLTFAHQTIAQIESSNLKEILTTIPTRYFIGNIANKSVEILNKALNAKLEDPESSSSGQFYYQEDSNKPFKIQNTDRFLDGKENTSPAYLEELIQYQKSTCYKDINSNINVQPSESDLQKMIQQFKEDVKLVLSSQKSLESSCLINISNNADRLEEIKSDIKYFDSSKNISRPRIRQQEISTIFQLAFGLNDTISNRKFISQLKSENVDNMFNQTDSGTRSAEFTDNGKTQTEQYYYLKW